MKRILYPVDDSHAKRAGSTTASNHQQALTPLEMAEMMARITLSCPETVDSMQALRPATGTDRPLVDLDQLALKAPTPYLPNEPRNGKTVDDFLHKRASERNNRNKTFTHKELKERSKKRSFDDDKPAAIPSPPPLLPWDLSFLHSHNPYSANARKATIELKRIATQFEAMPMYHQCTCSYKRFRDETFRKSKLIAESNLPTDRKDLHFNKLYSNALNHMDALVNLARGIDEEDRMTVRTQPNITREFEKKDFAKTMTNWMRANFTNPYPDELHLDMLANLHGTDTDKVTNWLINARTRKWRPAVTKAYKKKRPVHMFKEDSMNLFDGKPIRKLPGEE